MAGFHDKLNGFNGGYGGGGYNNQQPQYGRNNGGYGGVGYNQPPVNSNYGGYGNRRSQSDICFDGKMGDILPDDLMNSIGVATHIAPLDIEFLLATFDEFFLDPKMRARDDLFANSIVERAEVMGLPFMGEGTNRICVGSSDGRVVYKIAHRRLGENLDNRYEVCISKMIIDGGLPNTDRFALTFITPILGTLFIEQERIRSIREIVFATGARNVGPSGIEYILNRKSDYIAMIAELEPHFFLCDVHIVKPLNFGEDNRGRLKILDYGYLIPFSLIKDVIKLRRGHTVAHDGVYCTCGRKMRYNVPQTNIPAEYLRADNPTVVEEVYTCTCGGVLNTKEAHQDIVAGIRL